MKGTPVDVAPNGEIIFEFDTPAGKLRRQFPKTHPSVVSATQPTIVANVDSTTFPFIALVLPLDVEFPDDP